MSVITSAAGMQKKSQSWVSSGEKIGFVPTMGALHAGHLSLIAQARKQCQRVVVSIYVNPTQFGPKEDLAKYPRPRQKDLALCREAGVELVFAPGNLYDPGHSTWVEETICSQPREGAIRPGHFRGVATVVLKLLNLVRPTHAYFGQKDAQQVAVIQQMVKNLNVPVKLVIGRTIRDKDGLALSSRNQYLSVEERVLAGIFAEILQKAVRARQPEKEFARLLAPLTGIQLNYAERVGEGGQARLVVAVKIGSTRLLDNERIMPRPDSPD